MRWVQSVLIRMRSLFTRDATNSAVEEELEFHLEQAIVQNMARGMSPEAARARRGKASAAWLK